MQQRFSWDYLLLFTRLVYDNYDYLSIGFRKIPF